MVTIGIDPVAFSIGYLVVRWYGIIMIVAIAVAIFWAGRESERAGLGREVIYEAALWAIPAGLIVSRLFHVIDGWRYYMANPIAIIGFQGLTIWGAVVGAALAVAIYAKVKRIPLGQLLDVCAPAAVLGQAIGRVGCIINGCCFGKATDSFFSFVYTHPNSEVHPDFLGVPTYPAVAYQLLWNLLVFALLLRLRGHLKPDGSLFLAYLSLYSIGDFAVRFLRVGDPVLGGLYQAQLISLLVLVGTIPWLLARARFARS